MPFTDGVLKAYVTLDILLRLCVGGLRVPLRKSGLWQPARRACLESRGCGSAVSPRGAFGEKNPS